MSEPREIPPALPNGEANPTETPPAADLAPETSASNPTTNLGSNPASASKPIPTPNSDSNPTSASEPIPPPNTGGPGLASETWVSGQPTPCPPDNVWLDLCAGTHPSQTTSNPFPDPTSEALLHHAATCKHCAPLLHQAAALFHEDITPEEEALLALLPTSSATIQHQLATRLHEAANSGTTQTSPVSEPQPTPTPRRLLTWPTRWPARFATIALATAAGWALVWSGVNYFRPPSEPQLLAEAYDRQRPSELRIPGSDPGPLHSPTRGANPTDNTSRELLELKLRVADDFEKNPNEAQVRQMQGRVAIVEHDGEAARRNFELAEALDPKVPNLKFDLATAEFELAESSGQTLAYARAIDLFSQYLHDVNGQDPVALFNRGLAWERTHVNSQAIQDYEAALKLEKNSAWRQKIEDHLSRLETAEHSAVPLTPQSFLAAPHDDSPGRYELYLDAASREWLPHREDPQTSQALKSLAELGARHNDLWLADMLRNPAVPDADLALGRALTASNRGSPDQSLAASATAMLLYRAAGNNAGFVRAAADHLYGLDRSGQEKAATQEIAALAANPELPLYSWVRTFLQLQSASAGSMVGQAETSGQSRTAAATARANNLPLIGLRSASFASVGDFLHKRYAASWNENTTGLATANTIPSAVMNRFQMLNGMEDVAKALQLTWTQAGLSSAADAAITRSSNRQVAAYAREDLGLNQLRSGDSADAARSFQSADKLLSTLPDGPAAHLYRADWQTDRALLRARQQGPTQGLKDFAADEPFFNTPDVTNPGLKYYTEYAELLREANQTDAALTHAWKAVGDSENRLAKVHTESEREAWRTQTERAYQVLVLTLAQANEPELSLRAWEWFKNAPYRTSPPLLGTGTRQDIAASLPPLPLAPPGQLTLIYARVLDQYIAWSLTSTAEHPVRMSLLPISAESLTRTTAAFQRLCADRHSSIPDITLLGRELKNDLLTPFQDQIGATTQLRIDVDRTLTQIPFNALTYSGQPLGLQHALLFLPDWWAVPHKPLPRNAAILATDNRLSNPAHLVILRETANLTAATIPDEYDESSDIARRFPKAQLQRASLSRTTTGLALGGDPRLKPLLTTAEILHYTGHGLEEQQSAQAEQGSDTALALGKTAIALTPNSMPHCRLAVLAACRSMRDTEDASPEVTSFAHILLEAGANQVLATQWDVDSEMTRKLMLRFYAELADHQTFSEALRRAQLSLQQNPSSQHPYFWSTFQLIGQ
jgi:CHAT domain-containing protein